MTATPSESAPLPPTSTASLLPPLPMPSNPVMSRSPVEPSMLETQQWRQHQRWHPQPQKRQGTQRLPPIQAAHAAEAASTSPQTVHKPIVHNPYKKIASPNVLATKPSKKYQFMEKYRVQSLQCRKTERNSPRCSSPCNSSGSATPVSALELVRSNQRWRKMWSSRIDSGDVSSREEGRGSYGVSNQNDGSFVGSGMPLRPRLFLFRRDRCPKIQSELRPHKRSWLSQPQHSYQQHQQSQEQEEMPPTSPQPTRQPPKEGLWELGPGITELSGEGGSGKTQICLSLCVTCALTPLVFLPPQSRAEKEGSTRSNFDENSYHGDKDDNQIVSQSWKQPQICDTSMSPSQGSFQNQSQPARGLTTITTNIDAHIQNKNGSYYTAIYISMGEGIPSFKIAKRLDQMIRARRRKNQKSCYHHKNGVDDPGEIKHILSRIWLVSITNEEDFIEFIERHLPSILGRQFNQPQKQYQRCQRTHRSQQQYSQQLQHKSLIPNAHDSSSFTKVGLIVFDGISGFFRFSDPLFFQPSNRNSMFHRHRSYKLFQISSQLRKLSDLHNVPILITNQVTASLSISPSLVGVAVASGETGRGMPVSFSASDEVVPAL